MARCPNARSVQSSAISLFASGQPIGIDSITCRPWASTRLLAVGHRRCVNRSHTSPTDDFHREQRRRRTTRKESMDTSPDQVIPNNDSFVDCALRRRPPPFRGTKFRVPNHCRQRRRCRHSTRVDERPHQTDCRPSSATRGPTALPDGCRSLWALPLNANSRPLSQLSDATCRV